MFTIECLYIIIEFFIYITLQIVVYYQSVISNFDASSSDHLALVKYYMLYVLGTSYYLSAMQYHIVKKSGE